MQMHLVLKSTAEAQLEAQMEAGRAEKDRLAAPNIVKQPFSEQKVADQNVRSSSAEAATEVEISTNITNKTVRKFVMNQRGGAVEYSSMNPSRQVFVRRVVEFHRDSIEELMNGLSKRWPAVPVL